MIGAIIAGAVAYAFGRYGARTAMVCPPPRCTTTLDVRLSPGPDEGPLARVGVGTFIVTDERAVSSSPTVLVPQRPGVFLAVSPGLSILSAKRPDATSPPKASDMLSASVLVSS